MLCYLQDWTSRHPRPLICSHVLPSYHEQGDDGVDEVGKGQVKGAENPGAASRGTGAFEASLCGCNLRRECGKGLFERGWRGVVLLQKVLSAAARQAPGRGPFLGAHLPGPEGQHRGGCPPHSSLRERSHGRKGQKSEKVGTPSCDVSEREGKRGGGACLLVVVHKYLRVVAGWPGRMGCRA